MRKTGRRNKWRMIKSNSSRQSKNNRKQKRQLPQLQQPLHRNENPPSEASEMIPKKKCLLNINHLKNQDMDLDIQIKNSLQALMNLRQVETSEDSTCKSKGME